MEYISTRGRAENLPFDEVLLTGLARDGGLYIPKDWPTFSTDEMRNMRGLSYSDLAVKVMMPYVAGSLSEAELTDMVQKTYAGFGHDAVAPLKQLDSDQWMMELFHGPTLAFKDYAMQLLGRLFDHTLTKKKQRVTIVGATSGDTGSAAIEACRDRDAIDIFILFPHGRVSPVQQRQMTTVDAANVHAIALEGTFDDCQDMVKALFNDIDYRDRHNLSAVNSINWARLMPQIVYYFWAALALGAPDRKVSFAVPTGNFGNVFSAYAAKNMGLPIDMLHVGTNRNDILARFFETGEMKIEGVEPSLSPSMDIQVSSNFERLLFELYDRDGPAVEAVLSEFRQSGAYKVSQGMHDQALENFTGDNVSDEETLEIIAKVQRQTGEIIDPHSAIAVGTAWRRQSESSSPLVSLACAHAAKFPDAVEQATGKRPALPDRMADLMEREEHVTVLPNDYATVASFISERTGVKGAAA